jgi:hypothetical protein
VLVQTGVYWKLPANIAKLAHFLVLMNQYPKYRLHNAARCGLYNPTAPNISWLATKCCGLGRLPHSLINPNQLRAFGLYVNDDPFDNTRAFGIKHDNIFIPFNTTGTMVHFDTRVPTIWESTHLPVVLLTGDEEWNPSEEILRSSCLTKEDAEMQNIKSLMT